ncbi:MAG TPA: Scr1 family TA system antitoxin-like transcriptional regulator [Pseudonocardiaceae bacterium]|nr:Scr1 family TA system antitoxin-like transcriptional regulator [Pseudonocardiaceae bacterium]
METDASAVDEVSLMYVPGLLQTEDHMRALFTQTRRQLTRKELENAVAARQYRQRRLIDPDSPLHLHSPAQTPG